MATQHAHAPAKAKTPQSQHHQDFVFFLSPKETWQAMFDDCSRAKHSIEMEQYIFKPDPLGRKFIELFKTKANEGVRVRLMFDKIGSYELYFSSWVKELQETGVEIFFYNPITVLQLLHPSTWLPRDHTKTLLIDGEIAYTGGVCFDQKMSNWRDTDIRFTGPTTNVVQNELAQLWKGAAKGKIAPTHQEPQDVQFSYVVSMPFYRRSTIYQMLKKEINNAKKEICIVTPYFIPPGRFVRLLGERARRGGVKVTILVAERSDVSYADYVAQAYFHRLFKSGIRVFFYKPTTLHAKFFIIDKAWAGIGSTNIDYLSFLRNKEANIIGRDKKLVGALQAQFDEDLKNSREYTINDWKKRPLSHRIIGYLGRPLRRFM